jgi:hypothetical protein
LNLFYNSGQQATNPLYCSSKSKLLDHVVKQSLGMKFGRQHYYTC